MKLASKCRQHVAVLFLSVCFSGTAFAQTAGDPTDPLYIVISGRFKVMMGDADGKEVILTISGPGEFFGEMGLIDDSPRSASVVGSSPASCCRSPSATSRPRLRRTSRWRWR